MQWRFFLALSSLSILFVTGCWNRAELIEYSFVQAVAIDQSEEGKIAFTTHFYKPSGGGGGGMGGEAETRGSSFNIKTEGESMFDAVRDITIHLGRKAKWDHMRVILIGEELALKQNIGNVLDFFTRDHEPRPTAFMMITKGKASDYLELKPYIEHTLGEQFRSIDETSSRYSGKTIQSTLLDLTIQMKSETGIATMPYLYLDKERLKAPAIAGVVLLEKGKMIDIIPPLEVKGFLMLTNKFNKGIFNMACEGKQGKKSGKESFELTFEQTKVTPSIKGNNVTVHVSSKLKGSVGELICSSLKTVKDEKAFEDKIIDEVKKEMLQVIEHLQNNKTDALGIGNKVYAKKPKLWHEWKKDWNHRFAKIDFKIDVEVNIYNTGTTIGKPLSK